jgi:N4-gp56 family major capsid protein
MPESAALYLVAGAKIKIGSTEYTVSSADASAKTVTLSTTVASAIAAGTIVYSEDAGIIDGTTKKGTDIHATLVFGADAYGIIDVDGEGCLQTIVKPVGSGGASDPLDQRATVGAKVAAYTAKILNNLWIVRVEHGVSL